MVRMDLLAAAVRNNVAWCDVVTPGVLAATGVWTTVGGPAPLFPDAVTLQQGVSAGDVARLVDDRPTCSVKDSYADVDLTPYGFEVLFAARWLAMPPPTGGADDWSQVEDEGGLASWCAAAGVPVLPVAVLRDAAVRVCARRRDGVITGGAIVNSSDDVVGVSNVFGEDARPTVASMASSHFPQLPVVGYEHGADLDAALAAGFAALGPLRVWIRSHP